MLYCHLIPNFYPRSPCGERQSLGLLGWLRVLISIHALLAESDASTRIDTDNNFDFYPRSPCGERQRVKMDCDLESIISIHALLAESDPLAGEVKGEFLIFLSTLSLRRATLRFFYIYPNSKISIHALLAESDMPLDEFQDLAPDISIHALLAESDSMILGQYCESTISIHALLAESDSLWACLAGCVY